MYNIPGVNQNLQAKLKFVDKHTKRQSGKKREDLKQYAPDHLEGGGAGGSGCCHKNMGLFFFDGKCNKGFDPHKITPKKHTSQKKNNL